MAAQTPGGGQGTHQQRRRRAQPVYSFRHLVRLATSLQREQDRRRALLDRAEGLQRRARPTEEEHLQLPAIRCGDLLHRARHRLANHRIARDREQLVADPQLGLALGRAAGSQSQHVRPAERQVAPKVNACRLVQGDRHETRVVHRQLDAGAVGGLAQRDCCTRRCGRAPAEARPTRTGDAKCQRGTRDGICD